MRIFSIEKPSEESAVIIEGHTNAIKSTIWIADPNMIVSSEENSNIKSVIILVLLIIIIIIIGL